MPPEIAGYRETADIDATNLPLPRHPKQGIFLGRLDNLLDTLIERAEPARIITFGQFEDLIADSNAKLRRNLAPFIALVTNFHPRSRPVFWRILASQYFLFRAIRHNVRGRLERGEPDDTADVIRPEPATDVDLCWRDDPGEEVFSAIRAGHHFL